TLEESFPKVYQELLKTAQRLEKHFTDMQDLEFTIERGRLYMLQTRDAKRTAAAAVRIAVDMVGEGLISTREAVSRIEPAQVDQLLRATFDPAALKSARRVVKGLNASPGAAVGRAVFDADDAVAWVERGERVILVRIETSPDDFHGMAVAQGIITARGGATSHAAVVARQIGKPCVAGSADLVIDYGAKAAHSDRTGIEFKEGDWLSLDGTTGDLYVGQLPTVSARFEDQPELRTILGWADEIRRLGVWTNADKPEEAAQARSWGAQGIGLCRTEHMFREGDRLEIVRGAILVANAATRAKGKAAAGQSLDAEEGEAISTFDAAMAKLEQLQQGDFEGIFKAMDGLPVVIRLIDPPLHEFLPNLEDQLVKVTRAEQAAADGKGRGPSEDDRDLLQTIKSMHEQNPMLGLRGVRLGLMIPDFVKVQTRAILNAEIAVAKAGGHPIAKIMIPLVGHVNELAATKALLEAEAAAVEEAARASAPGVKVEYKFGTMIEVPRGALTADEIAREASFFSFGTNDLTQMTFGYSRDDAEGGFLLKYVEDKILPVNPFQTLDDAVADLMRIAVTKGRATRPDLEIGICGEHGGDPESIAKCERLGLDYVSCSPFRVPVARLAAAQAAIAGATERDK
ncbi:MAG TPA: putative PEP-binding protein, partial [Candidatus Binatus sp.]|nr:putative PEP-binding protein [Candidatus Binatus sp.]